MIHWLDYHITDVCNLNCAYCSHFTPLVPRGTKHKSMEQIISDLTLASRIGTEILTIMGGEPTLHPELQTILREARRLFPNSVIYLITNGTRPNIIRDLVDTIITWGITVFVSIYPNTEDPYQSYKEIASMLPPENVTYSDATTTDGMNFSQLTASNETASEEVILNCPRRWNCCQLKNGRIYLCHFGAQFNVLKAAFPDDIDWDQDGKEYIDLNGDINPEEVNRFLNTAVPEICRHCADAAKGSWNGERVPWKRTERKLEEWYVK